MAKLSMSMATNLFLVIIFIIILFQILADTSTDVGDSAANITFENGSDAVHQAPEVYPLTSFFKKKGIVLLALIAGVAIVIIKSVLVGKK